MDCFLIFVVLSTQRNFGEAVWSNPAASLVFEIARLSFIQLVGSPTQKRLLDGETIPSQDALASDWNRAKEGAGSGSYQLRSRWDASRLQCNHEKQRPPASHVEGRFQ
jgi:hypothetical protein